MLVTTAATAQQPAPPDPWQAVVDELQQPAATDALPSLLERAAVALTEGAGHLGDDAAVRGRYAEFVEALVFRLHSAVMNGSFPYGEPSESLLRRIDAALGTSGPLGTKTLLRVESLRALLGDWRLALERMAAVPSASEDRQSAVIQMLQVCQQYRSLEHGWPLFESWEKQGLPKAEARDAALYWRLRCALLTSVGMLDAASTALERARELLLQDDRVTVDQRAQFEATGMDLMLAAGRYGEALELAGQLSGTEGIAVSTRHRARLGAALAGVRRGDDAAAQAELATIAKSTDPFGQAAVGELVLVHLRAGRRQEAHDLAVRWTTKPLSRLRDYELVPLTWCALADVEAGKPPLVPLGDLHGALTDTYRWLLAQWRAVPPETSGVPFLHLAGRRDLLSALCAVTLRSNGATAVTACLDHLLGAEALGSTARSLGIAVRPFRQLRPAVVPAGGRLLAYLPAPTRSWLFVVDGAAERAIPLASDATLRATVGRLRAVVHTPPVDGWRDELRAASTAGAAWSLPDAASEAIGDTPKLAIVGRELLRGLPFEVLPWHGEALGTAKAVYYLPSMTLAAAASGKPVASRATVVLAATAIDAADGKRFGVADLPVKAKAFSAIAGPGAEATVLAPASCEDLLTGVGSTAAVAIVFAHGIVDASRTVPFGFLLGKGTAASGGIFAPHVTAAADIVLLAVCGLGAGGFRSGEDGGHRLSGAFLRAGASTVVSADADLPFDATRFWAEQFTAALRDGADVAEAARRARKATGARPEWAHPWHHAQLHVDGRGDTALPLTRR